MIPGPAQAVAQGPPGATALAWPGGAMDYAALAREAGGLAAAIRAASPPGRPVALVSASRRELALGVVAADWAGRAAMPLDPARPDLDRCLAAAGLVVGDCPEGSAGAVPVIDFGERGPAGPPAGEGAAGLVVSTSGTSGPPRLAVLGRSALAAQAEASARVLPPLAPGGSWLVCLPMTSIGGLAALWRAFRAGAGLAVVERFDAAAAGGLLAAGASHASVVPAMIPPLLETVGAPPATLRCLLSGGGPLSRTVADRALAAGWPLWTGWGMTETASHVAAGPVDGAWEEGVAGRPLPGVSVTRDPGSGRLRVTGPVLMDGYLGPEGPWGLEADGSFLTGDAGRVGADGRLRILGRADAVIVTGGVNVHPEEVEALLAGGPGIAAVAVTGVPDARWGQRVVAIYAGDASPEALDAWARDAWEDRGLPGALRPREWRRVDSLPRNAMGKPDRAALARLGRD